MIVVHPMADAGVAAASDEALAGRLRAALEQQPWSRDASAQVLVQHGVVVIEGLKADDGLRDTLAEMVRDVAGAHNLRDERIRVDALSGCILAMG